MYSIKEIFYTLQGEGAQSGRASVFCRFSGCNLWSGLERDRLKSACPFCDTDFVGTDGQNGGKYATASEVAEAIRSQWVFPQDDAIDNRDEITASKPYVVFTGGEPLLQLDQALVDAMHDIGFEVGVETNGSLVAPQGIDWLCVSPKAQMALKITQGDELKLLYPQATLKPEEFSALDFKFFFLQAIDDQTIKENLQQTLQYCLAHPQWRISLQIHKILDIE